MDIEKDQVKASEILNCIDEILELSQNYDHSNFCGALVFCLIDMSIFLNVSKEQLLNSICICWDESYPMFEEANQNSDK